MYQFCCKNFNYIVGFICFCLSFIIGYSALATVTYGITQSDADTNFTRDVMGHNFEPVQNSISGITLFNSCSGTSTVDMWLCKGNVSGTGDIWGSRGCAGDTLLADEIECTLAGSGSGWTDCYFDTTYDINIGEDYYFLLENASCGVGLKIDSGNPYASGEAFGANDPGIDLIWGSGYDFTFRTFTDDEFGGSYLDNVEIEGGTSFGQTSAIYAGQTIFSVPNPKNCIINEICYLPMSWAESIDNWQPYFFWQEDSLTWGNEFASTTLVAVGDVRLQNFNIGQYSTTTETKEIKILVDNGSKSDGFVTGVIEINWISATSTINNFAVYDIDSACSDVATSTGSTVDDIRYGLECAFRKSVYWAFTPKPHMYQEWVDAQDKFLDQFPVSVLRQVQLMILNITDYSTSTPEIDLQYLLPAEVRQGEMIILSENVIASTTSFFSTTWSTVEETLQYLVYALVGLYIARRFYKMARSNENSLD